MIQIELEHILTEGEAAEKISEIIRTVEEEKETYVITKDGKPAIALIEAHLLEQIDTGSTKDSEMDEEEIHPTPSVPMAPAPTMPTGQDLPPLGSTPPPAPVAPPTPMTPPAMPTPQMAPMPTAPVMPMAPTPTMAPPAMPAAPMGSPVTPPAQPATPGTFSMDTVPHSVVMPEPLPENGDESDPTNSSPLA